MKLLLLLPILALASCAGMPISLTFGATGQTEDGTAWHAGVNAPIKFGERTSAKNAFNVQPSGK